jgi:thioredoxin-dependent peroxiredoxin
MMAKELSVGDKAPGFELPGDDGAPLRLADLKGRPVALYFYPQDDTETCTAEAIAFNALRHEFEAAGARIIGVSPDSVASHQRFRTKYRLGFPLAADESRLAIEAYGVWRRKTLFGRTYMGVERSTFLIDGDGRIARIWRKVRAKGHAEAVLDAVKTLPGSPGARRLKG